MPRITLEQWRALIAVVDAGGYAQAAQSLHKTQSTVTYAVQKMESLLDVKVFEVVGRKAQLTPTGAVLYRRAKALLEEAGALEGAAGVLAAVVNLPWLNRIDDEWVRHTVGRFPAVLTLDNHFVMLGQGMMIAAAIARQISTSSPVQLPLSSGAEKPGRPWPTPQDSVPRSLTVLRVCAEAAWADRPAATARVRTRDTRFMG